MYHTHKSSWFSFVLGYPLSSKKNSSNDPLYVVKFLFLGVELILDQVLEEPNKLEYLIQLCQGESGAKETKESVMKFMKLGSKPDTFYTTEAIR